MSSLNRKGNTTKIMVVIHDKDFFFGEGVVLAKGGTSNIMERNANESNNWHVLPHNIHLICVGVKFKYK